MPTEHISYSYKFDELSDEAKGWAIEAVAGKLGGDWWDSDDVENVSETILYKLAEILQSPGWDKFGPGDFPGIGGVKLQGWDVDRGGNIQVSGELSRTNAPGLPWSDAVGNVLLESSHYGTNVGVAEGDEDLPEAAQRDACLALAQVVQDALSEALSAGHKQVEYIISEENARAHIEAIDPDFDEDGSLF